MLTIEEVERITPFPLAIMHSLAARVALKTPFTFKSITLSYISSVYSVNGAVSYTHLSPNPSIEEEKNEILDKIFITTLPWISYTSLIQPVPIPADSNPRISWGKYFCQEGKTLLPVSVLCHHGLVDGSQIGTFYSLLEDEIKKMKLRG